MGVHIDASQVDRLAVDLSGAPRRIQRDAHRTMERTALEIKRKMKDDFSGHRFARQVPLSLEYQRVDDNGLVYEIGELDSEGPQWGLAAILAFGTSNNAPVVDHTAALRREAPAMIQHLGGDAEGAVLGGPE
jgi:hypothetical protein